MQCNFYNYGTSYSCVIVFCTDDEWTMEEKVVFERAFHMHGKHFHRIKAFVSILYIRITYYNVCSIYIIICN